MVVGAVCVVLGLSFVWLGDVSETAAGFWPMAGVPLVAMILLPVRRWAWVAAAMVAPTVMVIVFWDVPISAALWWYVGNCVEPAFGALVLYRCRSSSWLTRGRLMVVFLVGAVLVAPMVGGAFGSIGTVVGYSAPWLSTWRDWVLGDALGILVIVPLMISYTRRDRLRRTGKEMVALSVVVVIATALAFADIGPNGAALLPYLILIGLIWAGLRFGSSAAAAAGFVVGLGANIATAQGYGPFSVSHGSVAALTLQIFLAIALISSFVAAAMASDLADRDEVHRLLTEQATHDDVTGLPNRVLFAGRLDQAMISRRNGDAAVGVLLINLDDFKKISDRHSDSLVDATLRVIGQRLRRAVRPADLVARLGGDEFVVLCEDIAGSDELRVVAEEVTSGLAPPIEIDGSPYHVTGSIGMALVAGDDPITSTDLLRRADIALAHAKRTAGVAISLFDTALEAHTRRRVEIVEELRGAIDRGELTVVYQPVVHLSTGRVSEFEALARWTNRRFGSVRPSEFIPIAEDSGLIARVGDFVLEAACRQLVTWRLAARRAGRPPVRVAVNASARQLCDLSFPGRVRRILHETALPADALTLEITETAIMDDLDASEIVLIDLREIGVRLSLDDFGTGYSSMTHLRRMPVHSLKIDCSFVAGLGVVAEDTAIVAAIINLGHSFGVDVIAEGIETADQLRHLARLGCDGGQGFLWSEGVDPRTASALMLAPIWVPGVEVGV